eukprot:365747-Chlamydomonas_euryale.AAC.50
MWLCKHVPRNGWHGMWKAVSWLRDETTVLRPSNQQSACLWGVAMLHYGTAERPAAMAWSGASDTRFVVLQLYYEFSAGALYKDTRGQ